MDITLVIMSNDAWGIKYVMLVQNRGKERYRQYKKQVIEGVIRLIDI